MNSLQQANMSFALHRAWKKVFDNALLCIDGSAQKSHGAHGQESRKSEHKRCSSLRSYEFQLDVLRSQ